MRIVMNANNNKGNGKYIYTIVICRIYADEIGGI